MPLPFILYIELDVIAFSVNPLVIIILQWTRHINKDVMQCCIEYVLVLLLSGQCLAYKAQIVLTSLIMRLYRVMICKIAINGNFLMKCLCTDNY